MNASVVTGSDSIGKYTEHTFTWIASTQQQQLEQTEQQQQQHHHTSPQPCAVEFDFGGDYNGNDLNQTHAKNPLGCCAACAQVAQCKLWTFSNSSQQCWLKTAKGPRRPDPDRTSGTPNSPLSPPPPGPPPGPAPQSFPVPLVLSYRVYPNAVMFTLTFPRGSNGTNPAGSSGDGWATPSTRFPAFDLQRGVLARGSGARYLSFQGSGATVPIRGEIDDWYGKLDGWPGGGNGRNGVPLAPVFATWQHDGTVGAVSNLDQFMTAAQTFESASGGAAKASEASVWSHGPGGGLTALPPGFSQRTLVIFANGGMNHATALLGKTVRSWHSAPPKLPDKTLTHLGYWTDNGAYYMMGYWYSTLAGAAPPPKNETPSVLLSAKMAELKQLKVPITYMQLDDYWYKTGSCDQNVCGAVGCAQRFEPRPEYFAAGLTNFSNAIGLPLHLYYGYMCNNLSWPEYNFLKSGGYTTVSPLDSERFFSDQFQRMKPEYNMIAFEVLLSSQIVTIRPLN
eukprot:COSAG01_NODE_19_length_39011_cov_38.134968_16_plen_508_part_00